jgi:hypothetical protein
VISEFKVKEIKKVGDLLRRSYVKEIIGDIERRELNARDWKDMNKLRLEGRNQIVKWKASERSRNMFAT